MALNSEEAIYKITRVVYERLGDKVEQALLETLVADIFTTLKPAFETTERKVSQTPVNKKHLVEAQSDVQRYIVSAFGLDRPGIVGKVASLLGNANCSIVDMNQTVVQGKFAMIMIVDATMATQDMGYLREIFRTTGEELGVRIYIQREDIFQAMHRV